MPIEFQYKSQAVNQVCVGLRAGVGASQSMINNYAHVPDEAKHRQRTILGKGTSGVAFLMREIATGRRVAVKQLSARLAPGVSVTGTTH